ncbi:MAG: MFS transporter [Bacteroidota bacterium]
MQTTSHIPLNDKRIINGWAMFDWANSSYALVIAVAIFPGYFYNVVDESFTFLGIPMTNSALFSYSLSFAYLLISLSLPLLSGVADYSGRKILFMKIFTFIGGISCISLYAFEGMPTLMLGVIAFVLAVIGFAGGQVFYNSFLPLIASEDQFDRVSAKGFSYGYIGSVLLLLVNLVMILKYEWFGLSSGDVAAQISFVMVGIWWIGFAQISFNRLPKDSMKKMSKDILQRGYQEIAKVWGEVKKQRNIKRFLFSFFFYSAGVQTVLSLASTFATAELKFDSVELIILILILQLLAIVGALIFSRLSERRGNKFSIITMLIIWMSICVAAYFVHGKMAFYLIAVLVGMVMGGIQSLSRSTYSKLLPEDTQDTASYFSFFDVLEKVAIVLGTFSFGFIDQFMGGMRNSILALIAFFVVGLVVFLTVEIMPAKKANAVA